MLGNQQPLRLPKKHAADETVEVSAEDGYSLVAAQSMLGAIAAGVATILVFSILWVLLTRATGRVFPWMTVLLGLLLGRVIRKAGHGVDWRFRLPIRPSSWV